MIVHEWRHIPGYDGYQASDDGQIRRIMDGETLNQYHHDSGYRSVSIYRTQKSRVPLVHRLVALAFLGEPPEGYQVNHKNGDKADNRLSNLEWVTPGENTRHAMKHLGIDVRGANNGMSKLTAEEVLEIRRLHATGDYTQRELARQFGISFQHANALVLRRFWQHLPRQLEKVGPSPDVAEKRNRKETK